MNTVSVDTDQQISELENHIKYEILNSSHEGMKFSGNETQSHLMHDR